MSVHKASSIQCIALQRNSQCVLPMPIVFGLCLTLVIALATAPSYAQTPPAPKPSDVRLVIDISGSMKKNDPRNLRRPALDMLVQLLPKGSQSGIWSFGQQVNMLVPHQDVSKAWGKKAIAASSKINSIAQFTNIGGALEKAAFDHQQSNVTHDRHVILLTDGMVDIDRDNQVNQQERQRILSTILPLYQQANIKLHTIALSANADQQLLNKLAFATDGKAATANTAEELMNVFLQVFNQAVPMEEAPFDGNTFIVDSSIEEFTALIFRKPNAKETHLVAPGNKQYTQSSTDSRVNWHSTDQYDLITVSQPVEGEWRVLADVEPQSRVTVVSDLSLSVKPMPTNITLNQRVDTAVALREENKIITRVEFLGLLDIDLTVTAPNGETWNERLSNDLVPMDGVYQANIDRFSEEGNYRIQLAVDGKSFKRTFSHELTVRKMFAVEVDKKTVGQQTKFIVEVVPQTNTVSTASVNVLGEVKHSSGESQFIPFIASRDGSWTASIPVEANQDMILSINAKGSNKQGDLFEVDLEPLRLSHRANSPVVTPVTPTNAEPPVVPMDEAPEVVADAEPAPKEPVEDGQWMQYILYGVIGVVNLLILLIGFIIYRKLFKKKPDDIDEEDDEAIVEGFVEPPMDEMAVEEIDDSDNGDEAVASEPVAQEDDQEQEDVDDTGMDDDMGTMDDDEEIPEFSLDDFSPEDLENESANNEVDDDSEEDKKE